MKRIASLVLALVVLGAIGFIVFNLLRSSPVQPESYEVQAARNQVQLTELQSKIDSTRFWNEFVRIAIVAISFFGALGMTLGFYWYHDARSHAKRLELLKLKREFNLLNPDQNGNFPAYINRSNGDIYATTPGNSPVAQPNYFVHGILPTRLETTAPRERMVMVNNYRNQKYSLPNLNTYDIEEIDPAPPEQLAAPAPDRKVAEPVQVQVPAPRSLEESLTAAKRGGAAKVASIQNLTGVTKGGSTRWKQYSEMWDAIAVN